MSDYDKSIHSNPDAKAWAQFFNQTCVDMGMKPFDEGWLIGWFANAMMAMHDHIYQEKLPEQIKERDRRIAELEKDIDVYLENASEYQGKLLNRLADWENSMKFIMDEKCGNKEKHCACVPYLKPNLAAKTAEVEKLLTEHLLLIERKNVRIDNLRSQLDRARELLKESLDYVSDHGYARDVKKFLNNAPSPAEEPKCVCGDPGNLNTIHRKDGPCYQNPDWKPTAEDQEWMNAPMGKRAPERPPCPCCAGTGKDWTDSCACKEQPEKPAAPQTMESDWVEKIRSLLNAEMRLVDRDTHSEKVFEYILALLPPLGGEKGK